MSDPYSRVLTTPATQREQNRPDQVENSAGGFVFAVNKWTQFERFLTLGTVGGSYYAGETKLTKECIDVIKECLAEDPRKVLDTVIVFDNENRVPKHQTILVALAFIMAGSNKDIAREAAINDFPRIVRTGTHLFQFMKYIKALRGWGPILRKAVANWYLEKSPDNLLHQTFKYQQREGWSHKDLITLSHPRPKDSIQSEIFRSIVKNDWDPENNARLQLPGLHNDHEEGVLEQNGHLRGMYSNYAILRNLMSVQPNDATKEDYEKALAIVRNDNSVTWEMLPTFMSGERWGEKTWRTLLRQLPITAMMRNLGRMSSLGILDPLTQETGFVADRLQDKQRLERGRVHPLSIFSALNTYKNGRGFRGNLTWRPNNEIKEALEKGMQTSFGYQPPIPKNIFLALDVSSSMTFDTIAGFPGITPRLGAAVLAKIFANQAERCFIGGFSTENNHAAFGRGDKIVDLGITKNTSFEYIVGIMERTLYGGTDCALPMLYADEHKMQVDAFVILTDSESWAGNIHPHVALENYRKNSGIDAKLIAVAMVPNRFSVADPNDPRQLDMLGFDAAGPRILHDFICS